MQCFVRRTLSSSIPFDSNNKIRRDIPMSHHRVIQAPFSAQEQKLYDKLTPPLYCCLIQPLRDGCLAWNMAKYRQLCLLTTWLEFQHVHESVKAASIPVAVRKAKDGTLLFDWMRQVMTQEGVEFDLDSSSSVEAKSEVLTHVLHSSPRLQALLPLVIDLVIRDKEKAIVWCLIPAQQALGKATTDACVNDNPICSKDNTPPPGLTGALTGAMSIR
ncbi:hypothetical protein FQN51_000708 [Onygenales sp. PD_10]|nr:hypothetical protein FQN51_000708 [Onygenales sp. PD_10]